MRSNTDTYRLLFPLDHVFSFPSPASAHQVRGGVGSRDRGHPRRGAVAAVALLPGSVLLAAQAGGSAEEAQVRGGA